MGGNTVSERFKEWETREDDFQLEQAQLRLKIRIQDVRAKLIDLLAKYITIENEDLAVEMREPDQITSKIQSGGEGVNISYWESLLSQLKAQIFKVKLSDLRTKLMQLRHEQGVIKSIKTEEFLSDTENIVPVVDELDCEDGQYSLKLIHFRSLELGTFLVEPYDDSE
uniref:Splicing factor cactin central domain-containing protein n=1 Tax=Strigamia maritima TaxID=126957 RepID=T1IYC6_STRMM